MRNAERMFSRQCAEEDFSPGSKMLGWPIVQIGPAKQNRKNMGRFIIGRYGGFVASLLQNGTCSCICRIRSWWNSILYKRQLTSNVLQVGGSVVKHRRLMWTNKNWRNRNDFALSNLLQVGGVSWKESFLMFLILEIRNYLFYIFLVA